MCKENILIVGDYCREDFLMPFDQVKDCLNLYFIEYTSKDELRNSDYKKYGTAIFWKDFSDAYDLLRKIKPNKVLFYFIETYNHVALNVASKSSGIKTYHLEHGIRNYAISNSVSKQTDADINIFRKFNPFTMYNRVKNRLFFANTVKKSNDTDRKALNEYYEVRSTNSILDTFKKYKARFRIADHYISFSPEIFEFHIKNDHLPSTHPVTFIGVPGFDKYSNIVCEENLNNHIVFIDQCLPEQGLLAWSQDYRKKIMKQINDLILAPKSLNMYVKKHPLSDSKIWANIADEHPNIVLLDNDDDLKKILSRNRVVIGFNSTLLLPLIAQNHTICFSLEIHPNGEKYSEFLTVFKSITPVYTIEELADKLNNIDNIHFYQSKYKEEFMRKWLSIFDGNSIERFSKILLDKF